MLAAPNSLKGNRVFEHELLYCYLCLSRSSTFASPLRSSGHGKRLFTRNLTGFPEKSPNNGKYSVLGARR